MTPVWLLDLELGGGRVLYVASEGIEVPSRVAGGARRYSPGLPDLIVERGADGVRLALRVGDYDAIRVLHGPLIGRRGTLRIWRGEAELEDGETVLHGVVADAAWGDPADPAGLEIELSAASRESRPVCSPEAQVARGNGSPWPDAHDDAVGAVIPTIIGRPGASVALGRWNDGTFAASPILCVDESVTPRRFAIADHHVDAATVTVYNTADNTTDVRSVSNTRDADGRRVATITLSLAFAPDGSESSLYAAWDDGDGATWEGRSVRGLGDLLVWGATQFGGGPWDLGEQRGQARELNRYLVDAVINDPGVTWDAWVEGNLVDVFGLVRVAGRDGSYWVRVPPLPDRARARVRLSTDPTGTLGHRVTRAGPFTEDGGLASQVTALYAQADEARRAREVSIVGRTAERATEQEYAPCHLAAERGGVPRVVYVPTVDPATARLVAIEHADRYSVPGYVARYVGSPELATRLRVADTVEIEDDGTIRWGVVQEIRLGRRTTEIVVRFA